MTWLDVEAGVRLRISDRRPDVESREPIVLVHGWKQSHRLFDRLACALLRRGHRVVSYDHRGMGESDKPDGSYDFAVLAADLGRVLAHVGSAEATVLGWSMGCTVVLEHLSTAPRSVARVVLHNGPLRLTTAPDFPHAMPPSQLDAYLDAMEQGWPASEKEFLSESLLHPDEVLLGLLLTVALQTPLDVALKLVRHQARLDHRPAVRALQVPVLAAYSSRDPYYPVSLAEWIAANAPDGRLALLERSAHCAPLEEPETLAETISRYGLQTGISP